MACNRHVIACHYIHHDYMPLHAIEDANVIVCLHLESCTPGQDWAKWYVLVRTSTYQYETVQGSTRIPYWYEAVCTGTYQYVLSNS